MDFYPKNRISILEIKKFIIIFYVVGLIGFIVPFTRNIFQIITPLALLMCVYLLAIFNQKINTSGILTFIFIYFTGLIAEIIGVNTGYIFGNYSYGSSLGPRILGTPLIIGINWLFLAYTSTSLTDHFFSRPRLTLLIAPVMMVAYDIILERAASVMDMWYWELGSPPIKNYITWYIMGLLMVSLIKISGVKTKNPLSGVLLLSQFIFLFLVSLFVG
jgi:putative membrane protein